MIGASNGVLETGVQIKTDGIGLQTKGPCQGGKGRFRFGGIGVGWGQKIYAKKFFSFFPKNLGQASRITLFDAFQSGTAKEQPLSDQLTVPLSLPR